MPALRLDRVSRFSIAPGFYSRFISSTPGAKDEPPMRTPRSFALLSLSALGVVSSAASAQSVSPSIIYWKTVTAAPNTTDHFKFTLNTVNNARFRTYPNLTSNPSSFSAYPLFGRVFFIEDRLPVDRFGTIPGTRKQKSVLRLVAERQTAESL